MGDREIRAGDEGGGVEGPPASGRVDMGRLRRLRDALAGPYVVEWVEVTGEEFLVLVEVAEAARAAEAALHQWGGRIGPWGDHPAHGALDALRSPLSRLDFGDAE